jgi:hypothetical protein
MHVNREGPRISVIEDGNVLWSGRTDAVPPEHIEYREDGVNYARPVAKSTDTELIHAVIQRRDFSK